MRLIYPERISYTAGLVFAGALSVVQLLEHTSPFFTLGCFLFIMIAITAFNLAGGLFYPSGAFVLFNALLTLVVGLLVKAFLGEPADSNLRVPELTISVYVAGMGAMLVAVIISRYFRRRKAFLADVIHERNIHGAYIGCIIVGVYATLMATFFPAPAGAGSFRSFFNQVNQFSGVGIVLGVVWIIKATRGRRSVTLPIVVGSLGTISGLFIGFSKQALFTPIVCWLVPASLLRLRLRWIHAATIAAFTYTCIVYLVPYAQVGRDIQIEGLSTLQNSIYLLEHFDIVRQGYEEAQTVVPKVHYFDQDESLLDRMTMVPIDDALIQQTELRGPFGYAPLKQSVGDAVPRVLWSGKTFINFGNIWAHEIGLLAIDDVTTGISFSPSADAYNEGGWAGVLLLQPALLGVIFLVLDSVLGDVRRNPACLFMVVALSHAAPEGGLTPQVGTATKGVFAIAFVTVLAGTMLPIIGRIFAGSNVLQLQRLAPALLPLPEPAEQEAAAV